MSQARSMNGYATAGGQYAQDDYFHVSANVYVPDGDAGTDSASCYRHHASKHRRKGPATLPVRSAALLLTVLALICGVTVGGKLHARKELSLSISAMQKSMDATRRDNLALTEEVAQARDSSRVCYIAVNEFGMIAAENARTHFIYVDEIEQFTKAEEQNSALSAAAELPLLSAQAQLSGSR